MVTSVTNAALFVQLATFVGLGGSGVDVEVDREVGVADGSVVICPSVAETLVTEASGITVTSAVPVSAGAGLHAARIIAASMRERICFLFIVSTLFLSLEPFPGQWTARGKTALR
jgi:hypothetical protein